MNMTSQEISRISSRYLVINTDDLGLQYCFNHAIKKGHQEGLVTSTCLRANGFALDHALEEIIPVCPALGLGGHICLNEGPVVAAAAHVPSLADHRGYFRRSQEKGFLFLAMNGNSPGIRKEVEIETRAQVEKLMKHVKLDHLNGHQHIHAIPWIFEITVKLAREYHIPFIRLPREPLDTRSLGIRWPGTINLVHYLNLQRWRKDHQRILLGSGVKSNDVFYGLLHSSAMTRALAECHLRRSEGRIVEILFHPVMEGYPQDKEFIDPAIEKYHRDPARKLELDAVLSQKLKKKIRDLDYKLTNYRCLASSERGGDGILYGQRQERKIHE
jgi:predicted glycoside hydrolase/deacetylase ChbG (UPF0249 family)